MSDTNNLIKSATCDIIAVISIWGLINNSYLLNNLIFKFYYNNYNLNISYSPVYTTILGTSISIFMLYKYS